MTETTNPQTLYKVTGMDGQSINGGSGTWFLPKGSRPGKWMPVIADLEPCYRGYHLTTAADLLTWCSKPPLVVWEVEGRGAQIISKQKLVVAQARLVKKVGVADIKLFVEFAADCAERVLSVFESRFPNDDRPRKAIEAARNGGKGAARAADAADAAYAADGSYAADAAYAADGSYAAARAAYAADAADAAYAADGSYAAARAAEKQWQNDHFLSLISNNNLKGK